MNKEPKEFSRGRGKAWVQPELIVVEEKRGASDIAVSFGPASDGTYSTS
ncbi:hypothetical protein [Aurantiacibacter sediminis]|uniref:Uncharacterized protein n=1 Tax=Aurantiacibacter sediminis TaxID=2793064 RepID=A0ABS0N1L6_9SPHN|nr:hypothetical protein [Aurantiacibacter sediminis]MBH5321855.1 hypothetical protein [Aurantiacibacter sediminis]